MASSMSSSFFRGSSQGTIAIKLVLFVSDLSTAFLDIEEDVIFELFSLELS